MQSINVGIFALCALLCCAMQLQAAPLDDSQQATILRYDNDNIGTDGYNFG